MKKPSTTSAAVATRANIQKREPQQSAGGKFLGTLTEEPVQAADNMKEKEKLLRDLNFKVDPEFHTKFKMTATASGKSMKDLLEECFAAWIRAHSAD